MYIFVYEKVVFQYYVSPFIIMSDFRISKRNPDKRAKKIPKPFIMGQISEFQNSDRQNLQLGSEKIAHFSDQIFVSEFLLRTNFRTRDNLKEVEQPSERLSSRCGSNTSMHVK